MRISNLYKVPATLMVLALLGCGSGGIKQQAQDVEKLSLLDTTPFIPTQEFDEKTSTYLPYEAMPNPYLELKGRIDKDAVTKFIQARRLFRSGSYQQADVMLSQVVALDNKLSGPWVMRGDIELKKDKLEPAIEHFKKAIEVNPKNVNAYIKLAKTQRLLGKFLEAQNTYTDALTVWRDFPEAHLNLGILYDIYLNHPLRAQKHMQAYQFLTGEKDKEVAAWISEIQKRTGLKTSLTKQ
ncbi:tetratricopeptide repeat protein [Agarilytica rhodophyticola]|uniref:tetratricopeptide repeat protein n=1 Tax=Agarilytica rhodophyticola TaxID=1737490 RepID=UPI001FE8C85C|nr:tetratricopeptide repeat protein [Agarilytica rhodophyticola]